MTDESSHALFAEAQKRIPGGVNSPVRAFKAVVGDPVFIERARGPYIVGVDGTEYVDYVGSWGPMILGHADPDVIAAVKRAADRGTSYGAPTAGETELAKLICEYVPSIDMVRLTSSGTEAVMGALRLARGHTGRDLVVKCEGAYHGGADYLLVKAGSGAATLGEPDSAGVPAAIASTTVLIPHNDEGAITRVFAEKGDDIAAVIVEPVAGNMGCVPPEPGWLEKLRELTAASGALLVFDEVMTGFRVHRGGAQSLFGIKPDLTCLGKIVGGGLPVGAYGGPVSIMEKVAPTGPVYQAGTLSGNPLAVAAGMATLRKLADKEVYERLEASGARLMASIERAARDASVECYVQRVGSMLTVFFTPGPVRSWSDANKADRDRFGRFHRALLDHGVYWPPAQFEAAFVSVAHDDAALAKTEKAFAAAFAAIA